MSRRKKVPIKPAPPVSTHPLLQKAEEITRRLIAEKKQTDPEKGASMSNELSLSLAKVDLDALRGADVLAAARAGHEAVHGTQEEKAERWHEIRAAFERVLVEHPEYQTLEQVRREVAAITGAGYRTVERHTKGLKLH